ncbi:hypothetical protein GCM10009645_33980 [Mycolicibacterium poriferae]|uniref:ARB-07466-like C-terminal domain-containing protein n=3 Tax=Mycolicibacterium TaxID=1866885 RepID=A0A6N4VFZ5_9MYCO|nr:hypothetical protein [Mycolicibacterium poriferae]BBX54586.1 hypothetical protein MPOR_56120 [Mycolicibacterium poriferae]SUE32610.1 NLP/P60 protein [Mycolicibacterium gilvum]
MSGRPGEVADTGFVSVGAVVAQVGEVLGRAHSLFGDPPASGQGPAAGSVMKLSGAGDLVRSGQAQMAPLSGQLATNYSTFAGGAGPALDTLAGNDRALSTQLDDAARSDRTGRTSSGGVVNGAAADTNGLAPFTNTPAGQKALLVALRQRVAQQQQVVQAYKTRDAQMAAMLRSMAYGGGGAGSGSPFGGGSGLSMPQMGSPLSGLQGLSGLSGLGGSGTRLLSSTRPGGRGPLGALDAGSIVARAIQGQLPPGKAPENGLQKFSVLTNRAVSAAFPQIREIGGVRADSLKWHPNGLALDVMIPNWNTPQGKALGDEVLSFVMANKEALGVDHAIWRQATYYGPGGGEPMGGRGGATANHFDHVHIATKGGGYVRT